MRYAIVKDGVVTNIAVSNRPLSADWFPIQTGCPVSIGDTYDGEFFRAPNGEIRMTAETKMLYAQLAEFEAAYMEGVQNA